MSDDSIIANCCGACFGICFLTCCESVLVALNFKKPGSGSSGSTQRGCCRNLGESTEDDIFEQNARRERLAESPKTHRSGGEGKDGKEDAKEERRDGPVTEQPLPPPEMTVPTTNVTKPDTNEAK